MSGSALANLQIHINVDAGQAPQALKGLKDATHNTMTSSQSDVEAFRQHLMRSSAEMAAAAQSLGANWAAANDSIMTSSRRGEQAMEELQRRADESSKAVQASAQQQRTAFEQATDTMKTKLQEAGEWMLHAAEKALAMWGAVKYGGELIGNVARLTGELYLFYKAAEFGVGLLTGSAYKSENIDALVAYNDQVKDLRKNLLVSAEDASTLLDVMQRLGVDQGAFVSAYQKAGDAMRSNQEELDRLGVKYEDANGQMLSQHDFLVNVKGALDQYTEGWDRNAAAAAIGAGSYEQVSEALRVTDSEMLASSDRLDEYQLKLSAGTQKAVEEYQQAMRDFENESRLTSTGFKNAIAQTIMPALTELAVYFKDGFPYIVRSFRYSMVTIMSLFYGLKAAADLSIGGIEVGLRGLGDILSGIGSAAMKMMTGDFSGAAEEFRRGWNSAGQNVATNWGIVMDQIRSSRDRMASAWGVGDDAAVPGALGTDGIGKPRNVGKTFVPKPKKETDTGRPETAQRSPYQTYLNELDQQRKKLEENQYAAMRLKAEQLAQKEGITDLSAAYSKINAIQSDESIKVVSAYTEKLIEARAELDWSNSIMGQSAQMQEVLNARRTVGVEVERQILQARQQGKPLTESAIEQLRAEAAAHGDATEAAIRHRQAFERSADYGLNKAVQDYREGLQNKGAQAAEFFNAAASGIEDGLTALFSGQQVKAADFVRSMIAEFMKLTAIKPLMNQMTGSTWFSTATSALGGMFGGSTSSAGLGNAGYGDYSSAGLSAAFNGTHANGLSYVPFNGYIAQLHEGERVLTKQEARLNRGGAGGVSIDMSGMSIGDGVSMSAVRAALNESSSQTVQAVLQILRRDGNVRQVAY